MAKQRRLTAAQQQATAYHEAGHAVAAVAVGVRVKTASIVPGKEYDGYVRHQRVVSRRDLETGGDAARLRAEKRILISLAGWQAQRRFNPRCVRSYHAHSDHDQAVALALSQCGSERSVNAFLRWLEVVTADIVEGHWPAIQRVAKGLVERGSLTGDEVRDLTFDPRGVSTKVDDQGVLHLYAPLVRS